MDGARVKGGYPLRDIAGLPIELVEKLEALSISTAEEFISHSMSDLEGLSLYLERNPQEVKETADKVSEYLDPAVRDEFYSFVPKDRPLGARSPYAKEYEEYLQKRRKKK